MKVTIVRGAGPAFCSGYDLSADNTVGQPYHSAGGLGQWSRHVVDGWFRIWDLVKPVIAQVQGYCLAGGSELATGCDLVYVAEDARIGYPPVRMMSPPDNQFHPWLCGLRPAMEMMLTGDDMDGVDAVRVGFAYRDFPADQLEAEVLAVAERVAKIPTDVQQMNKPLIQMSKAEIIRRGVELGLDYRLTHSCYDPSPEGKACGQCDSCLIREKGFREARIPVPTIYEDEERGHTMIKT